MVGRSGVTKPAKHWMNSNDKPQHKKIPGDAGDFFVRDSVTKKEVNDAVPNDVDEYLS